LSLHTEELIPKSELERAFVQAQSWTQIHAWKRGTLHLSEQQTAVATGIYIAMARKQALAGHITAMESTLDSLDQYDQWLTTSDKRGAVKALCQSLDDWRNDCESTPASSRISVERRWIRSAVAMCTQIKDDPAMLESISIIKHFTKVDLIATRTLLKESRELRAEAERCKLEFKNLRGAQLKSSSQETNKSLTKPFTTLKKILKKAFKMSAQVQVLNILVDLCCCLIEEHQTAAAKNACAQILEYAQKLAHSENLMLSASYAYEDKAAPVLTDYRDKVKVLSQEIEKSTAAEVRIAALIERLLQAKDKLLAEELSVDLAEQKRKTQEFRRQSEKFNLSRIRARNECKVIPTNLEETNYEQSMIRAADLLIADSVATLGEELEAAGLMREACECYSMSILQRLRAQILDSLQIHDLVALATNAVISREYTSTSLTLRVYQKGLNYLSDTSALFRQLQFWSENLNHLFDQIDRDHEALDNESFASLKNLFYQNNSLSREHEAIKLQAHILELCDERTTQKFKPEIMEDLWKIAFTIPPHKTFESFIRPLAHTTERNLGSGAIGTYAHYQDIFAQLQTPYWENGKLLPLWKELVVIREQADGAESCSLIMPLSLLARQYLKEGDAKSMFENCERIRSINKSAFKNTESPPETLPQSVDALFETIKMYVQMYKIEQAIELSKEVCEILKANLQIEKFQNDLCYSLCKFLATMLHDGISKPAEKFWIILNSIDEKAFEQTLTKLQAAFKSETLIPLLDEIIRIREQDKGSNHISILVSLQCKAKLLEGNENSIECDDVYLRAIEVGMLNNSQDVILLQKNLLGYLLRTNNYSLAFEHALRMFKMANSLSNDHVIDLFLVIDSYSKRSMHYNAAELMIAILNAAAPIRFDLHMQKTFDRVFQLCLISNEAENAQKLLARAIALQPTLEEHDNFADETARRFTTSESSAKLHKVAYAIQKLHAEKIDCQELEAFQIRLHAIRDQISLPDQGEPPPLHSSPD
jgi:hypothetical protein